MYGRLVFNIKRLITPFRDRGIYTPADDPDLFDWWDAQSGVSESGGELTAWVGSANSETADPPTVTSRPLYGTNQINSLDVLTFRSADPNYLNIDVSSLSTMVITMVVNKTSSSNSALFGAFSGLGLVRTSTSQTQTANTGLGTVVYRKNGSVLGTDITRSQLGNAILNTNCVLTLNCSSLTNLNFYLLVNGNLGLPSDAILGDIIISTSDSKMVENENFLIDKYGF